MARSNNQRVRGIRTGVPPGSVVGRLPGGQRGKTGAAQVISIATLLQQAAVAGAAIVPAGQPTASTNTGDPLVREAALGGL